MWWKSRYLGMAAGQRSPPDRPPSASKIGHYFKNSFAVALAVAAERSDTRSGTVCLPLLTMLIGAGQLKSAAAYKCTCIAYGVVEATPLFLLPAFPVLGSE